MTRSLAVRMLMMSAVALPCAFGYIPWTVATTGGATVQLTRADAASYNFLLNKLVAAGAGSTISNATVITAGSNPVTAVEAAMAGWNSVGGANVRFNALQTTALVHDSSDCKNVISIASTSADVSVLGGSGGVVALTINSYITSPGAVCGNSASVAAGTVIDSDVLLNPYRLFSTDGTANTIDLQAVFTHEFGHSLGMNHSGLVGATMYPYTATSQRHLSWDETSYAAAYYPSATKSLGTISGAVTVGGSPVKFGLVTAIDQAGGKTIGSVTAADGTYSVQVPPGSYIVYAEPFNIFIAPTNIYSTATGSGTLDPSQDTTAFEPTFLGSTASPTVLAVTTGATSTANIAVTSGASTLAVPQFYGIGKAGGSGDITSFPGIGTGSGGISVTAGTSFDLAFAGPGIDNTISLLVFGTGISVTAGPHTDPKEVVNSTLPVIRTTLSITSQFNATLSSIWIVKGSSVVSLSGFLNVQPSTPTISNVLDAESAQSLITSGQYGAIYGANLASTTRSWDSTIDFTGGVAAGSPLPPFLDGVSVTVNSVPAAVYFVCSVCSPNQINFIVPSNLTPGPASVVVTNAGTLSAAFTSSTIAQASPSFFIYSAGGTYYPVAVHVGGALVGDPAAQSNATKAHPGEIIIMFANGLGPEPGNVVATVTTFTEAMTMTAGTYSINVLGAALVYAGEFQVNVQLPANIPPGNYTLTMNVPNGSTGSNGITVILPVGS